MFLKYLVNFAKSDLKKLKRKIILALSIDADALSKVIKIIIP